MPLKSIYLPSEGLQGEDIPSHVIWEDMDVDSIAIYLRHPLKVKDVYNSESWKAGKDALVIKKVEWEGYLGLLFESSKTTELEDSIAVRYLLHLMNGKTIEKVKRIKLFRPHLEIDYPETIKIDADTGFVTNRIKAKNIGRGTLLIHLSSTEDSPTQLETPVQYREFLERYYSDLRKEMSSLGEDFPQFKSLIDEIFKWETADVLVDFSEEERARLKNYLDRLLEVLANNEEFKQGFVEASAKALLKNTELLETIGRFVKFYESLVSKNILLSNPFDFISVKEKEQEMILELSQTDRVFDDYEDITFPRIKLVCSRAYEVPIHSLFDWG